jgi:hypothetical protein
MATMMFLCRQTATWTELHIAQSKTWHKKNPGDFFYNDIGFDANTR